VTPTNPHRLADRAVRGSLLAAVFATATFQISVYDIWYHLAYGRWMAAAGAIPRVDDFSFTARGQPFVDHEWLFQLVVYGLWRLGGPTLLILAKAAAVTTTAALVLRFVEREGRLGAPAAAALTLPFAFAGRARFVERPELSSVLLAVIVTSALFRTRERPAGWRELLWIPPLFALWANLHAGVIAGLVLLAAATVGRLLRPREGRPSISTLAGLTVASTLATLLNPWGVEVLRLPFELSSAHVSGVFRNAEWQPPAWDRYFLFWIVAALALGLAISRGKRLDPAALLPLVATLALGGRFVRNVGLASMLAPVLALAASVDREARGAALDGLERLFSRIPRGAVAAALALLALTFAIGSDPFPKGFRANADRLPVAAVDYLERHALPGHLLNAHPFGGYAIWRLYPRERVYVDGRDPLYTEILPEISQASTDGRAWFGLLERRGIGHTLLEYLPRLDEVRTVDAEGRVTGVERVPPTVARLPIGQWALVHWDDVAMVHVRRSPEVAELVARDEYRWVTPESAEYLVARIERGEAPLSGVVAELRRKLSEDPSSRRARRLLRAVELRFGAPPASGG